MQPVLWSLDRSTRTLKLTPCQIAASIAAAVTANALVIWLREEILAAGSEIAALVQSGATSSVTSPYLSAASAAVLALLITVVFVHLPFLRTCSIFLGILLIAGVGLTLADRGFTPSSYAALWGRTQIALWIVMSWVASFLLILTQPGLSLEIPTFIVGGVIAVAWSALRLAFSVAVLAKSGVIVMPLLWFVLGPLAEFLTLIVLYSIVVSFSARRWTTATT